MATGIADIISNAAARYGQDPNALSVIAGIESNFNPAAQNPNSSAGGLFQFINSTASAYGLEDRFDAGQAADAGARLMRDNAASLQAALGRTPTTGELYLAHQQGAGGARALLSNPTTLASEIVGADAVRLNGGNLNMTAQEFANIWINRANRASGTAPNDPLAPTTRFTGEETQVAEASRINDVHQMAADGRLTAEQQSRYDAQFPSGAPDTFTPQVLDLQAAYDQGATVNGVDYAIQPVVAPALANVHQMASRGELSPDQRARYDAAIADGTISAPPPVVQEPVAPEPPAEEPQGLLARAGSALRRVWEGPEITEESLRPQVDPNITFSDAIEAVTGSERTTPEIEGMKGWQRIPELNNLSVEGISNALATGLGGALAGTDELAQIIQAQIPDLEMRRDEKGNYIFRSPTDGNEYAIKPGVTLGDIPRAMAGVLAFTPTGRMAAPALAARSAAVETGNQALQTATGGEFNPEQIPLAGAVEFIGPVLGQLDIPLPQRAKQAADIGLDTSPEALGVLVRDASGEGRKAVAARATLAQVADLDPAAIEAAQRLGMEIPADVLSNNNLITAAAGHTRAQVGSGAYAAWKDSVRGVMDKANEAMASLGGSADLAGVSEAISTSVKGSLDDLGEEARKLYTAVNNSVPAPTPAGTGATVGVLNNIVADLGGTQGLNPAERRLVAMIESTDSTTTYGRIKAERELLGEAAFGNSGAYPSISNARQRELYWALAEDQMSAVRANAGEGMAENLELANRLNTQRMDMLDTARTAFGRDMEGSIATKLRTAITQGEKGNSAALERLLEVIPMDLQGDAVASAIVARAKGTSEGFSLANFATMYRGLRENSSIYSKVTDALGDGSHEVLNDLYRVASRVKAAGDAIVPTGRANQAFMQGIQSERLIAGVLNSSLGKRLATMGAAGAGAAAFGPFGAAVSAALVQGGKGKTDIMQAAGKLFSSEEFTQLAVEAATRPTISPATIQAATNSGAFRKWAREASIEDPRQWLTGLLQSIKANQTEQDDGN